MGTASARGRAIGALTLGGAVFVAVPPVATALEPVAPTVLSESAFSGVAADLDGDGAREIALLATDDGGSTVMLQVWAVVDGGWMLVGRENVLRHVEDRVAPIVVDPSTDAVGLIVLDDGPVERVVVAAARDASSGDGCCLTLAEAHLVGGSLRLLIVEEPFEAAHTLAAVDTDGDGADELLASSGEVVSSADGDGGITYRLMRRTGAGAWSVHSVPIPSGAQPAYQLLAMDTDGRPGADLVLHGGGDGATHRFVADGRGGLVLESSLSPDDMPLDGWFAAAADGRILLADAQSGIHVAAWPRGGELEVTASRAGTTTSFPTLVGRDAGARIVVVHFADDGIGEPTRIELLDFALHVELEQRLTPSPAVRDLGEVMRGRTFIGSEYPVHPYSGPIPGGKVTGDEPIVVAGNLVTVDDAGRLDTRRIGAFAGLVPLGFAGPEDDWLLVSDPDGFSSRDVIGLYAGVTPVWHSVVPRDAVFAPEGEDRPSVRLEGAVELPPGADGLGRIAAPSDFVASISAPGSTVIVFRDGEQIARSRLAASERVRVEVAPRRVVDGNQTFSFDVLIVAPTGQVSTAQWDVAILREPPKLSAAVAEVPLFATRATVSGSAAPGSTVTVDGAAIVTDDDGSFRASVEAPIWPRRVVVTAADPVGNVATIEIEVIGVIDHRGWPWPIIVGLLTVAAGAVMYLRAPRWAAARAARPSASGADDDARLEELDGDCA